MVHLTKKYSVSQGVDQFLNFSGSVQCIFHN